MLGIIDLLTDSSDDISLNGDLSLEPDETLAAVKTAERRVTARFDDFLLNNVGAGIERYLLKKINNITKFSIEDDTRRALMSDGLVTTSDYKMYMLDEKEDGSLPIILKFSPSVFSSEYSFSVLINNQNQRSYN